MHPRETAARYDVLAEWYQGAIPPTYGVNQLRRALKFCENKGPALDVGCGSEGRFLRILLEHGFQPQGLDFSGEMIRLARLRYPALTFHHADICGWEPPRAYDFISAWDSTFHLPVDEQEPVLRKLCAALKSRGILLFTCGGTERAEITGSFNGQTFGYSTLGVNEFLRLLMQAGCDVLHVDYDQYPERHVVIIARRL